MRVVLINQKRGNILMNNNNDYVIAFETDNRTLTLRARHLRAFLQSNQVKRTPKDCINELIIWILNLSVVSIMQ